MNFNFNFPFMNGDFILAPLLCCIHLQLIKFAIVCSNVSVCNNRNKCLTAMLLRQGYRYQKLHKAFLSSTKDTLR